MFEFKKGKSSDKVLSEQEIQQKLYGRFLSNKNVVAGASEAYTRPAPKASAGASSAAVLFPEDTGEELTADHSRSSELISEARPAERKTERKEPAAAPAAKEVFREKFQSSENDLLKTVRNKSQAPKITFQKVMPKLQMPELPIGALWTAVSNAFAAGFNAIFGVFFAIGRVVDFRREGVRTGLAWGSGLVMLVLLLAAIQGLNSKREIAMKTSVPKAPKKIAAKAVLKKAAVPVAADSQEQEIGVNVADRNEVPLTRAQEDTKVVIKKAASAEVSRGRFVIQVATYVIRDDANRLLQDLQKIEPKSFVKGLSRSSGKTYFSVFLGRFESFQEGQQALAKFKKTDLSRSFKDAFIRTLEA
jgi:hypothetical protein